MPRPSKHFLSLVNMPEDSGMSLKEYFYKIVSDLNKERYYLGTDTEEQMERHNEIACTLHTFSRYKPYNWPPVDYLKIAKEPISLDSPIEDDEDSQLKDFSDTSIKASIEVLRKTALGDLTPEQERSLRVRFGIFDVLEDTGMDELKCEIEVDGPDGERRKLRHPRKSKLLEEIRKGE